MTQIKATTIIGTLEDLHGEKRTKEDLLSFCESMPKRLPLGVEHDMGKVSNAYLDNFDVVPAKNHPGEWSLIGDLYMDKMPDSKAPLKGLSFSFTKIVGANSKDWQACVFLPFPYYNSSELNEHLLNSPVPLAIGKWHKKALNSETIALIYGVGLFVLGPVWNQIYDEKVRPYLDQLFTRLKEPDYDELAFDYVQDIELDKDYKVTLILVSDHENWKRSLSSEFVRSAIATAEDFLRINPIATLKKVKQLRLRFSSNELTYRPFMVQYEDGEHLTIE